MNNYMATGNLTRDPGCANSTAAANASCGSPSTTARSVAGFNEGVEGDPIEAYGG